MNKKTFLLLTVSLILPVMLHAADYYVSPSGPAAWLQSANINTPCSAQTAMANAKAASLPN